MSNDNDNSEFFSNDEDLSLEDIIAQDAQDNAKESASLKKEDKKEKTKKVALISSGVVLAAAVVAGIAMFNPFGPGAEFNGKDNNETGVYQEQQTEEPKDAKKEEELNKGALKDKESFVNEEGKLYPITVDEWQQSSFKSQEKDESLKENILTKYGETDLENISSILPLEAAGFTSDSSKKEVDGELNPMYSFWTAEEFEYSVAEQIERLLNPTFGGWGNYQYKYGQANKAFDTSLFDDMFTSQFLESNVDKKYSEYIPVYADWSSNDYGMSKELLSSGTRWIGELKASTADFDYNEEEQNYTVRYSADVKFSAWAKDESKLEKNGKLNLTLVANTGEYKKDSKYKVLINNASLKVDG